MSIKAFFLFTCWTHTLSLLTLLVKAARAVITSGSSACRYSKHKMKVAVVVTLVAVILMLSNVEGRPRAKGSKRAGKAERLVAHLVSKAARRLTRLSPSADFQAALRQAFAEILAAITELRQPVTPGNRPDPPTGDVTTQAADVITEAPDITTQAADVTTQAVDVTTQTADDTTQTADDATQAEDITTQAADDTTSILDVITRDNDINTEAPFIVTEVAGK